MLIGILCEVISGVAKEEAESMMVEKVNQKIGEILSDGDENLDGKLSWDEFRKVIEHPEAIRALESVNVDPCGMIEVAEDYFFEDSQPKTLNHDEFMGMILDFRGGQQANLKDLMGLEKRFTKKHREVASQIGNIEGKIDRLMASSPRRK